MQKTQRVYGRPTISKISVSPVPDIEKLNSASYRSNTEQNLSEEDRVSGWKITIFHKVPQIYEVLWARRKLANTILAQWDAGPTGLEWIDKLAVGGHAIVLLNSQPCRYAFSAKHVMTSDFWQTVCPVDSRHTVIALDPLNNPFITALPGWMRNMRLDQKKLLGCDPESTLILDAWTLD